MKLVVETLLDIARRTAWGASDILLEYYKHPATVRQKKDGPVTTADLAADRFILAALRSACGSEHFAYLSEETVGDGAALHERDLVWVVDPIDGTRDFIEHTGEFAVHIALLQQKQPLLGVVAWPVRHCLYFASRGGGAFCEDRTSELTRIKVSPIGTTTESRVIIGRDRRLAPLLARLPQKEQIFHGGLGCKLAAIAAGEAELYFSLPGRGGPRDWDLAAPQIVLTEAGGSLSRFDGEPLAYLQPDLCLRGGIVASNGIAHRHWLTLLNGLVC